MKNRQKRPCEQRNYWNRPDHNSVDMKSYIKNNLEALKWFPVTRISVMATDSCICKIKYCLKNATTTTTIIIKNNNDNNNNNMHNPAPVLENNTYTPIGRWHAHRSPNLSQKTTLYKNQQKTKNLQNCRLCCSSWPQNKTERIWIEG